MSRQCTSLATTKRSSQMLRLTTCTPGIRWHHHCTFLQEREASETTVRSGLFLERQRNNCSQQNPRSWDLNTERILPKIIFVNWSYSLILKQWKLGILEQGMNSSDENKLCFTKNWQVENEHFVKLVFEVFKSWKNWREQEFRLEFSIRKFVENHFNDVESVRSGQLFDGPSPPALFPLPHEPGGLLSRDQDLQPIIWDTHGISGNFFGWSTCVFSRNAQFKGFLCYGKFSSASKYGETRNRKWWWRPQPILSRYGSYPKQPGEIIDRNSNALPEGVYLENCRVKKSQVSAER